MIVNGFGLTWDSAGSYGGKNFKKNAQKWKKGIFGLLFDPKYDENITSLAPNEFQSLDILSIT